MDQKVFHKLQLEILNAIDLLLLTMTYGICWYAYYGDEIASPFYDLGNEIMVALFAILYYFISHLYHGYRISISRISDLVYSQTLAVFFADAMMYVITVLINRHLINPIPLGLAFLVQFALIIGWCTFAHHWYFRKFPPKKTVIILGEGREVNPLIKRYGMDIHFEVIRTLTSEECLSNLDEALQDAESIFLCGIHSHERNIIVKYCVARGIDSFVLPRVGDVIMSSIGLRLDVTPSSHFTFGASRVSMLGGKGNGLSASDWGNWLTGKNADTDDKWNDIGGFDFRLRYGDFQVYGEAMGEDQAGGLPSKWAYRMGLYLPKISSDGSWDLTFEAAKTTDVWYTHWTYQQGWTYSGDIMGDDMGNDARKYYARVNHYLSGERSMGLYYLRTERERNRSVSPTVNEIGIAGRQRLSGNRYLTGTLGYAQVQEKETDRHLFAAAMMEWKW